MGAPPTLLRRLGVVTMFAARRAVLRVPSAAFRNAGVHRGFPTIVSGVDFETIAREWRCKWCADNDKTSLAELQKLLDANLATLKGLDGAKVQRIVCGGCLDFKVITALPAAKYTAWSEKGHAPEAEFLKAMEGIKGVSAVETQTYTIEPM